MILEYTYGYTPQKILKHKFIVRLDSMCNAHAFWYSKLDIVIIRNTDIRNE